ncbi:MAG TPA: hypothetical protein VK158_06300 [Acidobacteriota bacterium]|nr:hypothetical protein [Acidobacteriota bacterium]
MEISIISEKVSKLLKRKEVAVKVTFTTETTPSRAALKDAIAKKLKADAACVIVRSVNSPFGGSSAEVTAMVYDNAAAVAVTEGKPMIERNNPTPKAAAQ